MDASGYALGGVLSQLQDNKWHSVAFISRTMTDAELNYDIYDKELLAIMYALKEWCPYLLDAREMFEIWTDHKICHILGKHRILIAVKPAGT